MLCFCRHKSSACLNFFTGFNKAPFFVRPIDRWKGPSSRICIFYKRGKESKVGYLFTEENVWFGVEISHNIVNLLRGFRVEMLYFCSGL